MSENCFEQLYPLLMERLDRHRELPDQEILDIIDSLLTGEGRHLRLLERANLRTELFNAVRRLDLLQELIDDDGITEIMVNGTDGIYYERDGRMYRWEKRIESSEKLEDLAMQIAARCNRVVNESSPIVDARLANGARVNIVMAPIAVHGPVITIRRFPNEPIGIRDLLRWESITVEAADFLRDLVRAGYNIFISGGTGSGKTTFLNVMTGFIPGDERLVCIEDNCELQITGIGNLVRLEARAANEEGMHEVTIRDLIRASLRMRPSRIIVGEVRGSEAIDMITAFNTGHDGSLSTGHANSPADMLSRLETMYAMGNLGVPISAIRRQIAGGVDILVHLGRLRDKSRRVLEIVEVAGYHNQTDTIQLHPLFTFAEQGEGEDGRIRGSLVKVGSLLAVEKLKRAGIYREMENGKKKPEEA